MLFNYEAIESASGSKKNGSIDAVNVDVAISSLQRRNLVLVSIKEAEGSQSLFGKQITWFDRVSTKDVVILSRQLATLFDAQVSALRIFRLLSTETENKKLAGILQVVSDDIQSGSSISAALTKHPKVFSPFYVSMVKAGEESGKLDEEFQYLADYLDRNYELVSKVSLILAIPEGTRTAEHVRWAFALIARDVEEKMLMVTANDREKDAPMLAMDARLLAICSIEGGELASVIYNRMRGKSREDIDKALARLCRAGSIRSEDKTNPSNKKVVMRYHAIR